MPRSLIITVLLLAIASIAGISVLFVARSRPSPESFNRQTNTSPKALDKYLEWLFSHTLTEVRAARGDMPATREAWIRYFQRGHKAGLSLDELMKHLEELFPRAQYPDDEARRVLTMLKALSLSEIGVEQKKTE